MADNKEKLQNATDELSKQADELSDAILKALNQTNNPIVVLIPVTIQKILHKVYMDGYDMATDNILNILKTESNEQ